MPGIRATATCALIATIALAGLTGCVQPQLRAAEPLAQDSLPLSNAQLLEVARELERRGDSLRAEQYYVLALERGAPADEVLPRLLAAYVRDRQYRLAAQRAEDYLAKHPRSVRVRLILAALCEATGDYAEAVTHYQRVVHSEPSGPDAHFALASVLVEQGHDRATADQHFRRYLELAPRGAYAERAQAALLTEVAP
jgi:tetratricopeptide (TPR) repeat protein